MRLGERAADAALPHCVGPVSQYVAVSSQDQRSLEWRILLKLQNYYNVATIIGNTDVLAD